MYLYLLRIENLSARLKVKRKRTVIEINILRRKNHVYHRKQTSKKFKTLLKCEKINHVGLQTQVIVTD